MAKIVSVSLLEDSVEQLNSLQKQLGLKGKSETIRAALKSLENETKDAQKMKGIVQVFLLVTHEHANLVNLVHQEKVTVLTHLHQHVKERCVEVFLLSAPAESVRVLLSVLAKNKKVLATKIVLL